MLDPLPFILATGVCSLAPVAILRPIPFPIVIQKNSARMGRERSWASECPTLGIVQYDDLDGSLIDGSMQDPALMNDAA